MFNIRAILAILVFAFSSTAAARPEQTSDCVGCHDANTDVGQITVNPIIDVGIGSTGNLVTFSLSGIPTPTDGDGRSALIALWGMDEPLLGATIGTPDNWSFFTTNYQSDSLNNNSTGYSLTFDIASNATLGTYGIDAYLVGNEAPGMGDSRWIDTVSFNIQVVPIPAAVWLFGSGLIGLIAIARRRRKA